MAAAAVAAALLGPLIGSTAIDLGAVWRRPFDWAANPDAAIFFVARLPRVLLALLVGGSLALAGATFQSLLRNPLATPYTLGISSGATLAAFLALRIPIPAAVGLLGELTVPAASLAGSLVATAIVMGLAGRRGELPTTVLLLAGVSLNFTFGAFILLLQYFADFTDTARMVRWLMGDLEGASYRLLAMLTVAAAPAWVLLARSGRALNLLALGRREAAALGVATDRAERNGLLGAAWLTGLSVAAAGPVGFVGIIVPHALRLLGGSDYRVLLPASLLGGGAFLVLCDAAARTLLAPVELPIGVLTACLGGPFFLALLLGRRGRPGIG